MASNIDITQPPAGAATTAAVRGNFNAARTEIEALQSVLGSGTVPAFTNVTFTSGWINFGSGYAPAQYRKLPSGLVELRGMIKSGSMNFAAFTLPAGYRPAAILLCQGYASGSMARFDILSTGEVKPVEGSNVWFSLGSCLFMPA